tara:strand:+ start:64 stop:261 length:198 start_codon:yes stop_codon:yes gene_type:complete
MPDVTLSFTDEQWTRMNNNISNVLWMRTLAQDEDFETVLKEVLKQKIGENVRAGESLTVSNPPSF